MYEIIEMLGSSELGWALSSTAAIGVLAPYNQGSLLGQFRIFCNEKETLVYTTDMSFGKIRPWRFGWKANVLSLMLALFHRIDGVVCYCHHIVIESTTIRSHLRLWYLSFFSTLISLDVGHLILTSGLHCIILFFMYLHKNWYTPISIKLA